MKESREKLVRDIIVAARWVLDGWQANGDDVPENIKDLRMAVSALDRLEAPRGK